MEIGKMISALRRERGATQEEVARAVGVSAAAVSKWEAGKSCPDLGLIMPLSRFFGVTTDKLLGFQRDITDAELDQALSSVQDTFAGQGWEAGMRAARQWKEEYPGDGRVAMVAAAALQRGCAFAPDPQALSAMRRQQEQWLERAAETSDRLQKNQALYMLASVRVLLRDAKGAREALDGIDAQMCLDSETLLPTISMLEGDLVRAEELAQKRLKHLAFEAGMTLGTLSTLAARQGRDEAAQVYSRTLLEMTDLFGLRDELGMHCAQSLFSRAKGKQDGAELLEAVQGYVKEVLAVMPGEKSRDAGKLFSRLGETPRPFDRGSWAALASNLERDLRENEAYADVRGEDAFQDILTRLQEARQLCYDSEDNRERGIHNGFDERHS